MATQPSTPTPPPPQTTLYPVTAADFQTGFQVITVTATSGTIVDPMNPDYCATQNAGQRYLNFLKQQGFNNCVLIMDAPLGTFRSGGPVSQEDASGNPALVPFILFTNPNSDATEEANVGQDIMECMHFGQDFFARLVQEWYGNTLQ